MAIQARLKTLIWWLAAFHDPCKEINILPLMYCNHTINTSATVSSKSIPKKSDLKEIPRRMKVLTVLYAVIFATFVVAGPAQANGQGENQVEKRQVRG
ncbi:hypothetical protein BJX63DRAFT_386172 [Aspergillus granulosus]|uniref:Uncharacterized protein n=1 Tax=Aspergillus granulosus TaxID=176169 RepID=A0ABR4HNQ3_9EURO